MRALQLAAVLYEALVLSRTGLTSLRLELLHHIHPAHRHTPASISRAVGRLGKCLGGGRDAQTGGRVRVREGKGGCNEGFAGGVGVGRCRRQGRGGGREARACMLSLWWA